MKRAKREEEREKSVETIVDELVDAALVVQDDKRLNKEQKKVAEQIWGLASQLENMV